MNVQEIRKFNRYYSRLLGVFDQNVFDLNYSMAEMRLLGEISRNPGATANALSKYLAINKGYLSRMVSKLEKAHLIYKIRDDIDNRLFHLYLTKKGRDLNEYVDKESNQKVVALFERLEPSEIDELIISMKKIERLLEKIMVTEMEDL
ncbi:MULTISPECIES: MarR family transcriptional regulator [unclassified Enterococcus]|uniref:MarR family winged helix-turn-helix transcriptional regulator n=1 Tax=unclassified Enterococcus TaxID=2608891 RepID=UPI0015577A81|nr:MULTISPECIES: MarR family transcriptional regulator [unclassified Enterococcus]MBS7576984.1 MarR family transcriptional regulator [Enterococcus sp. MMGLQ5-2]MBS7584569.1 MarR family transcriptional regulator [Enterococcus sp. MMGLQ5-1]NPD12424.1 MarR family transcriptional regulator [Enterococcus sp. MMGLQ5-1]NPD36818.1 MarR family transcriptional regulator [Enterococcus sp. MMGLQ5-2]